MDRYVIKERRPGAEYPQGNQMITFPASSPIGNNITIPAGPDFLYYGPGELPVQRTPAGFVNVNMNTQRFVPNMVQNPGQIISGIDPSYLAAYSSENMVSYTGAAQQMNQESNQNRNQLPGNVQFGSNYQNHNFYPVDKVATKTLPQQPYPQGRMCKLRWSNIRDNFRKNIQKNVNKSGQGRKSRKPYKYHEQLSFLVKFFDKRSNIENVNDEESATQDEESNIPESSLRTQAISPASESDPIDLLKYSPTSPASQHSHALLTNQYGPSLSSRCSGSKEYNNSVCNKGSVRTASSEVMDYVIRQNEHPVDLFLASLAPILKELHPCDLFDAKSEMFAIVQKYESKLLRNKFPMRAYESSTITSQNRCD